MRKSLPVKPVIIGVIILCLLLLVAAIGIGLYATAKLKQGLLTQAPAYDSDQLYSRAVDQVNQGDYQQAETYLQQALQKQPDDSYRNQLAVVEYQLKKYDLAIAQYEILIQDKQDPAFAYNGIGNAYRDWAVSDTSHTADYQAKAETAYRQAIAADPQYIAAYSNLALLQNAEGKQSDAVATLQTGFQRTQATQLQSVLPGLQGAP